MSRGGWRAALAASPVDTLCFCGHTASCHGPDGCEVEVRDYGDLDCACTRTFAASPVEREPHPLIGTERPPESVFKEFRELHGIPEPEASPVERTP